MANHSTGRIKLDIRDSKPDWDAFLRRQGARGRAERARGALRRHRAGGVVAVRRADRDADAAAARRQRPDVLAVAHDRAVLADALVLPHRAQPPPERLRLDLRDRHGLPGLQLPHPAGERDDGDRAARHRLQHVLGRQEPQHRRSTRGRWARRRRTGRSGWATTASTASSAARPTSGIPTWPRTTTTSTSPTCPRTATTSPRTSPTRRCEFIRDTQAVRARQALVPVVLPGRQPRPAPRARRSSSTSTRASSTTATRPTASGCCRA